MAELPSRVRVAIIGGGAVGASCLYHLAKAGISDAIIIEKNELTSGSTWHAAGNTPNFSSDLNVMKLQNYGNRLFDHLGEEVGYPMTRHRTGAVRLAHSRERMEEFHHVAAMAAGCDIAMEPMTAEEMQQRHFPWMEIDGLVGGLWDPGDGDVDPAQLTQAYASGARQMGARIFRFTKVVGIERCPNKRWKIVTDKGSLHADIVVNAAGYYAPAIGRMVGRDVPMVTMAHQYLVTGAVELLPSGSRKIPMLRDPDDSYYLRQEGKGLILGPYEWQATPHWLEEGPPEDFAFQLYPDDLDRLEDHIAAACVRVPMLATGGVQKVINGPVPYTPDGLPLVGPAPGLEGFYEACAFSFGIVQSAGCGRAIAQYVKEGESELDLWMLDPRRFTDFASKTYCVAKAVETYQNEYAMQFEHREWPAGRPCKSSPLYETLRKKGAVFGARGGWERALWFAKGDDCAEPDLTHGRPHFFDRIGEEVRTVTSSVGVCDLTGFSRFELSGEGAASWLDGMITGSVPSVGKVALSYFCAPSGRLFTEMTITRLCEDRFWLIGAAAGQWHDRDWLMSHLPQDGSVVVTDMTASYGTLAVAGPKSREVLASICPGDVSNTAFPWLTGRSMTVDTPTGTAEGVVLRVGFTGELGYELHMPMETMLAVYRRLFEAGAAQGIGDFGMNAMESMRLEKGYRAWKQDLSSEYSPLSSGLHRFVRLEKPDFIGKQALLEERKNGSKWRFIAMELSGGNDIDAPFGAPVLRGGEQVGLVTSGGFGHRTGKSIALGYLDTSVTRTDGALVVMVYGVGRTVAIAPGAGVLFDPSNENLRA